MNLETFKSWLGKQIYDMNNPLALIVEIEIKKKQQVTDTKEDRNAESKKNVRCWLCKKSHKVSDGQTLKNIQFKKDGKQ